MRSKNWARTYTHILHTAVRWWTTRFMTWRWCRFMKEPYLLVGVFFFRGGTERFLSFRTDWGREFGPRAVSWWIWHMETMFAHPTLASLLDSYFSCLRSVLSLIFLLQVASRYSTACWSPAVGSSRFSRAYIYCCLGINCKYWVAGISAGDHRSVSEPSR